MNKYEKANEHLLLMMNSLSIEDMEIIEELVERATPKKVLKIDMTEEYFILEKRCPECESELEYEEQQFCDACGQALDWSDDDE